MGGGKSTRFYDPEAEARRGKSVLMGHSQSVLSDEQHRKIQQHLNNATKVHRSRDTFKGERLVPSQGDMVDASYASPEEVQNAKDFNAEQFDPNVSSEDLLGGSRKKIRKGDGKIVVPRLSDRARNSPAMRRLVAKHKSSVYTGHTSDYPVGPSREKYGPRRKSR